MAEKQNVLKVLWFLIFSVGLCWVRYKKMWVSFRFVPSGTLSRSLICRIQRCTRKWRSAECSRYANCIRSEHWSKTSYLWCRYNYNSNCLYPLLTLTRFKRVLTPILASSLLTLCDLWLIYIEKTTRKTKISKKKPRSRHRRLDTLEKENQNTCECNRENNPYLICGNKMPNAAHPANRTHNPQLHTRPATWKTTAQNTTRSNHCIILLSSWWWA